MKVKHRQFKTEKGWGVRASFEDCLFTEPVEAFILGPIKKDGSFWRQAIGEIEHPGFTVFGGDWPMPEKPEVYQIEGVDHGQSFLSQRFTVYPCA